MGMLLRTTPLKGQLITWQTVVIKILMLSTKWGDRRWGGCKHPTYLIPVPAPSLFFLLQNFIQCCNFSLFLPFPATLVIQLQAVSSPTSLRVTTPSPRFMSPTSNLENKVNWVFLGLQDRGNHR